jgi:hypothetical protein
VTTADLDRLRANALKKIDSAERWFKASLFGAVLFECLFTLGILYFVDWRDPLQLLIVCCTGVIYMPVVLGLVALGAHMNRCTLRVLARLDDKIGANVA